MSTADLLNSEQGSQIKKQQTVKRLYTWTNEQVLDWLNQVCEVQFKKYEGLFKEHDVTGKTLMTTNDAKLRLIGIENSFDRDQIMYHIVKARLKFAAHKLEKPYLSNENLLAS